MQLRAGYQLEQCLGGGPMTVVFAAREEATDRAVALKLIRPDWEDPTIALHLLRREARVGSRVRHPHLVPIEAAYLDDPLPFLVMPRLRGESVRERLRRQYRLKISEAVWIARQTAQAVEALQKAGCLHGDVKPENLIWTEDGTVVLLDLGFAHRPGENIPFFEQGYLLGTPHYLAPELCGPNPEESLASDRFSLGVLIYELLTGQLPYPRGSLNEVLTQHHQEEPADIRQHRRLPERLARLVMRLLERSPENRPSIRTVIANLITLEINLLRRRSA